MDTIYEELQVLENSIKAFPVEAHWFCAKVDDEDITNYNEPNVDDEHISNEEKRRRVNDARERHDQAYNFIRVFGLPDDEQETAWKDWYAARMSELLTSCDKCVKNYHAGRVRFLGQLTDNYDEGTIEQMSEIIDQYDTDRIEKGLTRAIAAMESLPEKSRTLGGLAGQDPGALQALYEALCCKPYLAFKDRPSTLFDRAFELIQTNKPLVLGDLVPATTEFLFDATQYRLNFAMKGWTGSRTDHNITPELFSWIIQDALLEAMRSVSLASGQPISISRVQRFWGGVLVIVEKLDEELIIHSLRALEATPDIYHLALEHLPIDNPDVLNLIIKTLHLLIQKSSKSLWDSYGSISPSTVAEQIFNSPAFLPLLSRVRSESDETTPNPALLWIPPFIRSLGPNQQFEACRTMVSALLVKYQDSKLDATKQCKVECFGQGLDALVTTLNTFVTEDYHISASTSFITINNVLGLVDEYKTTIIQCALMTETDLETRLVATLSLDVIRLSLLLDCKALRAQFLAVRDGQPVHHGLDSHSKSLWRAILDALKPDNMAMASDILSGIIPLNGIDHFQQNSRDIRTKALLPLTADEQRFEKDFTPMTEMISEIYQRLSDFKPENLRELCENPKTSAQMFAGLTPADKPTYDWTVDIIKTVTGEETRKDAISKLLSDSLHPTLTAMFKAVQSAASLKTYAAFPHIVKTGSDTIQSLCDAQDGILRTKANLTAPEQIAIKNWWRVQWKTLETAFRSTERWSHTMTSSLMTDFVRDTMDFAEALFDNYAVVASALSNPGRGTSSGSDSARTSEMLCKSLLEQPRKTMSEIAKWLRLRDPYLVSSSSSLVCKLLRRLGQFGMEIEESAKDFIKAALSTGVKTVLTGPQKAELSNAFKEHFGFDAHASAVVKGKDKARNGIIDLEAWTKKAESRGSGDEVKNLTRTADSAAARSMIEQMRINQKVSSVKSQNNALKGLSIKESREREKKAKAARDAEVIARAKSLRGEGSAVVAGEGSALGSLAGGYGKEHAPPRSEMMVSSDSESSSSDDDATNLLIKKKTARKGLDPKLPTYEGPVKKKKIVRSVKDMRARLTPPLEPLHQIILDWDFFHDKDTPPGKVICQKVANKFRTTQDYNETFMPLLVSEAWRTFKTAKDEQANSKAFEITIVNRMSVDSFFEVSTSVPMTVAREQGLIDGDIVLLSKGHNPANDQHAPHCLGRIARITRKKDIWEISYRISGKASGQDSLLSCFSPKLTVRGLKVTSMTTVEREYGALHSFQYYDLCEEVLSAKPSPLLRYAAQDVERMRARYEVNSGQAKAILSVRDNDGFTLIQGPPGSGKTKTIVAMVGALLTDTLQEVGVAIARPGNQAPASKSVQKKLLICAPSNAAVDELVMRLKAGVLTTRGEQRKISVIRLGRTDAVNANVKDVTLDELVRRKMEGENKGAPAVSEREKLHIEAGRLKAELAELRPRLDAVRAAGNDKVAEMNLQRQFEIIKRQQNTIGSKIDEDKDKGNTAARDNELNRHRIQQHILDGAHVLCSTLSASGHDMFKKLNVEFETVIIDEAAQCIELSALIPLKYGCSKCILVGDPKQLPPTVLSKAAAEYGYEQSLFVRMQMNYPDSVHLLDTQYRMHPEISLFPSRQFYDGKLIDGDSMAQLRSQPWHASSLLGPYRFFDVKGTQSAGSGGRSIVNLPEVHVALQIYERVRIDYPEVDLRRKIGIITPYKAQLAALKSQFAHRYGEDILEDIDFNTTDSFQGREAEIIIFSCVRAAATGGIGFMSDIRRMNVGLTRAKSSLWVLGNSEALLQGEFWSKLVHDAKARQKYTEGNVLQMLKKPVTRDELQAFARAPVTVAKAIIPMSDPHADSKSASPMEGVQFGLDGTAKTEEVGQSESSISRHSTADGSGPSDLNLASTLPKSVKKPASAGFSLLRGPAKRTAPIIRTVTLPKNNNGKRTLEVSSDEEGTIKKIVVESRQETKPEMTSEQEGSSSEVPSSKPGSSNASTSASRPAQVALPPKRMKKRPTADPLRRR